MDNILEVKNLSVSFMSYIGEIRAVRDVSFSLKPGETLAIVGESGCGKTVTVKALMRLFGNSAAVIKEGSQILFRGQDIAKMKKTDLLTVAGLNPKTLARMGKDETVSMDALGKLCTALNCRIEDIVEFVPDPDTPKTP